MFGSDAYALMGRKPELSFAKIYRMLGRVAEHPLVQEIPKQYFPYEIYTNQTSKNTCIKLEDTYYTPEELIAMILNHVKEMTLNFGGKKIKDCVITVPSSFTQHERAAVYTAAEIADLNILSLIEENTAAALHYGIDRVFDTPYNVLFYNMGAGTTQVHIVSYSSYPVKEGGKNKTIGQFEVLGKAWDSGLGGFNFDVRLADLLAQRFNAVWNKKASGKGKDLRDLSRPMTRLRLEANKVKEVLSANSEYPIKAEQLHADVDLITKITRAEFEEACQDLFARLTDPIDRALAVANLTLAEIHSVELIGGSVRMPKVKKTLDEYFKESKLELGQHINGDEAMALGAAFRAANLSTAFRVRKVGMTDVSSFDISVHLSTLPGAGEPAGKGGVGGFLGSLLGGKKKQAEATAEEGEGVWRKSTTLYPSKSAMNFKLKTVAFHYDKDILCQIEYDDGDKGTPLPAGTDKLIAVYNVTGIAAFSSEAAAKGVTALPKVHLSFSLDTSGMVHLAKAEITAELPSEPEAPSTSNSTESADNSTESASNSTATAAEEDATKDAATAEAVSNTTDTASNTTSAKKDPKKKAASLLRKQLSVQLNGDLLRPALWTRAMVSEARIRIKALQDADDERKAKEAALNELEGFIYKVKNRLLDDEEPLKAVSTDEQRQEVLDLASNTEEWLYDEGRDQTVAVYAAKQADIKSKADAIFHRFAEIKNRAEAVTKARKLLSDVKNAVSTWAEKLPHITQEETDKLLEAVAKTDSWLTEKEDLQAAQPSHLSPVYDSSDVPLQLKPLGLQFDRLLKKPRPAPVTVVNATASSNSSEGNSTIKVELNDSNADNSTTTTTAEDKEVPSKSEDQAGKVEF